VKESRAFVRWLGIAAVFAVVLQGVLGGLRVALHLDQLGIFHAALAQSFLVLICLIALFTSRWWISLCERISAAKDIGGLRKLLPAVTALIFVQLLLGATMRHQHAGLSIPDFPLAYGKLWPAMAPASVTSYNQRRLEVEALNPITATQIVLQMAHRIMALLILIAVGICAWSAWKRLGCANPITRLAVFWVVLILAQAALGAFTIWSNKAADVATAHVLVGAVSLVTGALLTTVAFRVLIPVRAAVAVETPARRVVAGQPAAASAK
jgi:cytochrome c oxidase assembly protein subunit 15